MSSSLRIAAALALLQLALALPLPANDALIDTAVIPLKSASWADVKPMIEPMLSADGTLGYMQQRHVVIVHDYPPKLREIRKFLEAVDAPEANIRLQVEFLNDSMQKSSGLRVSTPDGPPRVTIRGGDLEGPDTVVIEGHRRTVTSRDDTSQFLMARSGHPARLWAGEATRRPETLRRYLLVSWNPLSGSVTQVAFDEVQWADEAVGASLWMLATYRDDGMVDVEIFPVVTARDRQGRSHSFRVQEIETRVVLRHGERTLVGGVDGDKERRLRELFAIEKTRGSSMLSMYLTANVRLMDRAAPVDRASDGDDTWRPDRPR